MKMENSVLQIKQQQPTFVKQRVNMVIAKPELIFTWF